MTVDTDGVTGDILLLLLLFNVLVDLNFITKQTFTYQRDLGHFLSSYSRGVKSGWHVRKCKDNKITNISDNIFQWKTCLHAFRIFDIPIPYMMGFKSGCSIKQYNDRIICRTFGTLLISNLLCNI